MTRTIFHLTGPAHEDNGHDAHDRESLRSLEERLRRLNWPEPPLGLRERTLQELRQKLAERGLDGNGAAAVEDEEPEAAGGASGAR
jgi:hypothetical protein